MLNQGSANSEDSIKKKSIYLERDSNKRDLKLNMDLLEFKYKKDLEEKYSDTNKN